MKPFISNDEFVDLIIEKGWWFQALNAHEIEAWNFNFTYTDKKEFYEVIAIKMDNLIILKLLQPITYITQCCNVGLFTFKETP